MVGKAEEDLVKVDKVVVCKAMEDAVMEAEINVVK